MSISPEKRKEYSLKYKLDGRAKISQRKHRYGLDKDQFEGMLREQNSLCLICLKSFESNNPAAVDHDHATGEIRGLIHRKCNSMIGLSGDDPEILERAASYLRSEKWTGLLLPSKAGLVE